MTFPALCREISLTASEAARRALVSDSCRDEAGAWACALCSHRVCSTGWAPPGLSELFWWSWGPSGVGERLCPRGRWARPRAAVGFGRSCVEAGAALHGRCVSLPTQHTLWFWYSCTWWQPVQTSKIPFKIRIYESYLPYIQQYTIYFLHRKMYSLSFTDCSLMRSNPVHDYT